MLRAAAGRMMVAWSAATIATLGGAWATPTSSAASAQWDWSHTHTWADFGVNSAQRQLTDTQAAFVASHYEFVSLEKCFGVNATDPLKTEAHFAAAARQLKRANSSVQVLFYWASDQVIESCYVAAGEFMKHPEWWLRNSSGGVISNHNNPFIDVRVAAARDWWVSTAINVVNASLDFVDGVFVDGSGWAFAYGKGLLPAEQAAVNTGHQTMIAQLTNALHDLKPDAVTLGNGLNEYSFSRPDHGVAESVNVDGECAEHFGAFEGVLSNSLLNATIMESWIEVMQNLEKQGKIAIVKTWPGPVTGPITGNGGPSWPNRSSTAWTYEDRRAAATQGLAWSHAAFLLVAAPQFYMSYSWWYNIADGYVPCDSAVGGDGQCSCPDDWYPELLRPTGAPLGPPVRVGGASGHLWQRNFEHVSVSVDLADQSVVSIKWDS